MGNLMSQNTHLKVKYKLTKYFTEDEIMPGMPNDYTTQMLLKVNTSESLYMKDPDYKEPAIGVESGFMRRMLAQRSKSLPNIYKNLANKESVTKVNFFDKDFLILDSLALFPWKISAGEQKNICGFTCIKAIYKDSTHNVVVYFSPSLLSSHGPDNFYGLPGLIMEVQSADLHAIALNVEKMNTPIEIEVPQKGTRVTAKEYEAIREQKIIERKEMMKNRTPRMITH